MPNHACYIKKDQLPSPELAEQLDYLTRDISFVTEKLVNLGAAGDLHKLKQCESELNLALSAYLLARDRAMSKKDVKDL